MQAPSEATQDRQRTALVTGGMSGIGAAVVDRLRSDGVQVIVADINPAAEVVLDVSSPESVATAAAVAGPVDILVNSAGIVGPNGPFQQVTTRDWDSALAVNLSGTFYMCRELIPQMAVRGWGRVVNMASMAGKDGNAGLAAYSASKAGVIGLTKSLGKELATSGVLVNAVAPAVIESPMNASTSDEVLARLTSLIPMRRLGRADEVAELISWLASDRCSFSTGAVYDISGGRATY
jgi:NAD(P)-dependent dehydrogenase (short-subunit alcohol dehydrogenase family)